LDGYVNPEYGLVKYMPLEEECAGVSTGIIEDSEKENFEFTIYPNPFNDEIDLRLEPNENVEFILIDNTGRYILNQKVVDHIQINTERIQSGIYFYQIKTKGKILAEGKIIKMQ
jgi:predicted  nucleic acid-binding Zn-ribbon protein